MKTDKEILDYLETNTFVHWPYLNTASFAFISSTEKQWPLRPTIREFISQKIIERESSDS